MNSLTKATIATAAGVALFLGGAGSLALWNDSANLGATSAISDGMLTIDANGSWDSTGPVSWVPGDSITYTATVDLVAKGDNLRSELSIDPTSITGDADLLSVLDVDMAINNVTGGTLTETNTGSRVYAVAADSADGAMTADVTVTVTLPASVSGTTAQGQTAALGDLSFLLQQV